MSRHDRPTASRMPKQYSPSGVSTAQRPSVNLAPAVFALRTNASPGSLSAPLISIATWFATAASSTCCWRASVQIASRCAARVAGRKNGAP